MPVLKLILNADDYGLSPLFNKGILELARQGIVSSVSVMIKKDFVNPADFKNLDKVSVGLHLTLKKDGSPLPEIEYQIKKFKKVFKKNLLHLDSHYHLHLSPANFNQIIALAKKYDLPVRSRFNSDRLKIRKAGLKTPDRFISWHPGRINALQKRIEQFKGGVLELVCHPGYYDKNSDIYYNYQREKELEFLKSRKFAEIIKQFEIINYGDL